MDLALALFAIVLCGTAAIWVLGVGISHRLNARLAHGTRGTDPITGPKDRVAVYDNGGPFIAMPDGLKTNDEMVAWLTKELPKLTAQNRASSS